MKRKEPNPTTLVVDVEIERKEGSAERHTAQHTNGETERNTPCASLVNKRLLTRSVVLLTFVSQEFWNSLPSVPQVKLSSFEYLESTANLTRLNPYGNYSLGVPDVVLDQVFTALFGVRPTKQIFLRMVRSYPSSA